MFVCVTLRKSDTWRERDICGCPLEETWHLAWFFFGFQGFDAAPAVSSYTNSYTLWFTVADYMLRVHDCRYTPSKKIICDLCCSSCCIPSTLTLKATVTSELAEASMSCRRTFLSAVVWVSLTERPICCHFCSYTQRPLKQMVLQQQNVDVMTERSQCPLELLVFTIMTDCKGNSLNNRRCLFLSFFLWCRV